MARSLLHPAVHPIALVVLVATFAGCSKHPSAGLDPIRSSGNDLVSETALTSTAASDFYPIDAGDRWVYRDEIYFEAHPIGDTTSYRSRSGGTFENSITCDYAYGEGDWKVERTLFQSDHPGSPSLTWRPVRRDRDGVYELEIIPTPAYPCGGPFAVSTGTAREEWIRDAVRSLVSRRSGAVGASALPAEALLEGLERMLVDRFRRLDPLASSLSPGRADASWVTTIVRARFPLHRGATWAVRPETDAAGRPSFEAVVEGSEVLELAGRSRPAWRIRIRSSSFGPDDRTILWIGREGLLQLEVGRHQVLLDDYGQPIGEGFAIERQWLTALDLGANSSP